MVSSNPSLLYRMAIKLHTQAQPKNITYARSRLTEKAFKPRQCISCILVIYLNRAEALAITIILLQIPACTSLPIRRGVPSFSPLSTPLSLVRMTFKTVAPWNHGSFTTRASFSKLAGATNPPERPSRFGTFVLIFTAAAI